MLVAVVDTATVRRLIMRARALGRRTSGRRVPGRWAWGREGVPLVVPLVVREGVRGVAAVYAAVVPPESLWVPVARVRAWAARGPQKQG